MRLRFPEDRRTLLWAFVLFPLAPALAYARPALTPFVVPLALYLSYCSGVLVHNHSHCPVFRGRRANLLYGAWLSIFYGFPSFAWVPTHNQNHHRYLNGDGDVTRTTRHAEHDSFGALLTYPLASSRWQLREIVAYFRAHRARAGGGRARLEIAALVGAHLGLAALALALHGWLAGALVYVASAGLPALLASYFMMATNYVQHVGCDPLSPDDHSRNFTSPFWNWFVFENGLHTVHHEHPGTHWSRYPALHAERAGRIAPALNQRTMLGYLVRTYLLRARGRSPAPVAQSRMACK